MDISRQKIYFVSDCHLGIPDYQKSLEREKKLVRWLDEIKIDAEQIFILGDLFDFWFEYKTVVPKGYVRLLGKLAELRDNGIEISVFSGNHDMWLFDYFSKELNIPIIRKPVEIWLKGKKFFLGHGDGLGPGDHGYKFIKKLFANRFCQWLFARLHPNFAIGLGLFFSKRSRLSRGDSDYQYKGDEYERLLVFAQNLARENNYDFIVFGHRHFPLNIPLKTAGRYINLGDWIHHYSYGVFDGEIFEIRKFEQS